MVRNWGQSIGISPVVHGDYSYPMEAPITIDGDFVEAVSQLTEAFSTAEPRPLVDFWIDGENFAVELTLGGRQ
ncbi:hypothetical protein CWS72_27010 [Telmatospirillum siberiense]|uniref:Uncharacterized protein n=1 Tax=Telmatospirillum siberiense TaxID=382514 RepID=A0A2N3PLX1_9PROT|nr:hypothetical protein CWS72_27010 [Telmatospirillum siberiense]